MSAERLLVVTSSWPRTADEVAGTFVRTDAIARARHARVIVAAPAGSGVARGGEGLEVVDVPHGGAFGSPGALARVSRAPWRIAGLVPFTRSLRRLVEARRPSRIVAHWLVPSGAIACAIAPRDVAIELVAHGGDVRLFEAMPTAVARACLEALCERADVVRVVSEGLLRRLCAIAPRTRDKALVAPMPLAIEDPALAARVSANGRALRASFDRPLHVVASRLVREKGIERAIDHAARVRAPLVLVGDGPERAALVDRARRRGVDLRTTGALPHEEALAWIAAADVLLAPLAPGEGAPTAIREARALGVRVLAFA